MTWEYLFLYLMEGDSLVPSVSGLYSRQLSELLRAIPRVFLRVVFHSASGKYRDGDFVFRIGLLL